MSEAAVEAVVEDAPATEGEGGDTTVVVAVEGGGDPEPEAESGDTTVVVVEDTSGGEAAQDDATNLDHEQRITRLEERLQTVANEVAEKPSWESVQSMIPSYSETADIAATVASEVAAEVVEDIAEDGDVDGGTVVVPDVTGDGVPDVVAIDPGAPPVNERKRASLFRW
jgi:hypothetical protein